MARANVRLRDVKFERTTVRQKRGQYLAEGPLACFRCHSDRDWAKPGAPPAAGREGAGHIFSDDGRPWLVAPNITSDADTGAGRWTDDMLGRAIREGVGHDGRILHPQMWYLPFRDWSDEDVASIVFFCAPFRQCTMLSRKRAFPLREKCATHFCRCP